MFKYKSTEPEIKQKIADKLPQLEEIVDQIMFQRMRWDVHFFTP